MSLAVRPAAVSGVFYPNDAAVLAAEVDAYLDAATDHGLRPKAVIAPHAGYRYSAGVAASAYAGLRALRGTVRRVVLLGPAHRVAVEGLAIPSVDAFETPLGHVRVDAAARALVAHLPRVVVDDGPHAPEHSLEVHLPFLMRVLGPEIEVLPVAVGNASADEVADLIERCWGGDETLVVVSSDLSHYLAYDDARSLDERTTRAIEHLRPEDLRRESACGVRPVMGLLLAARRRGLRAVTLDVRNSGDTQGGRDRVVGYGSWAIVDHALAPVTDEEGQLLLRLAASTVELGTRGGVADEIALTELPERLEERQAAFVTLHVDGALRGCVGGIEGVSPLARAVARAAHNAAFADPRFPPLTAAELPAISLSVSVLSPLERLLVADETELLTALTPRHDGLVLTDRNGARGVFLPQVWDQLPDPAEFVGRLKHKAGLAADRWSATLAVYRFRVQHFE